VSSGRARASAALVVLLALAACSGTVDTAGGAASLPASRAEPVVALPGELIVVLPPSDRVDPLEHARVRAGAARALEEVLGPSRPYRIVSAPTMGSIGDVVEQAARSADIVCVLGHEARPSLEAALLLYPRTVGCGLPAPADGVAVLGVDLDLQELGLLLGRAARAAAGTREVLVLAGGDALHGVAWLAGVSAGAAGGPVRILGSDGALRAELERAGEGESIVEDPEVGIRSVRNEVGVVVLDASPGAAELALELLERGVLLIAPRAFVADATDTGSLVMRWRVRWDLPLTGLLRRAVATAEGTPPPAVAGPGSNDAVFALEDGPAHVAVGSDPVR